MPSRLIGKEVQVRLYADRVEVYYKGHLVEGMARVHGEREANVNYRHVIGSSRSWPGGRLWCESPEPSAATASRSNCSPPCISG